MTNFSNLFSNFNTTQDYLDARDDLIETDENHDLKDGISAAGVYNYQGLNAYTIGYGFDIRKFTGQQIIKAFRDASVGIFTSTNTTGTGKYVDLYTKLLSYVGGETDANFSSVDEAFATAFDSSNPISSTQAKALLDYIAPQYERNVLNTAGSFNYAVGNNSLHEFLFSEDYVTIRDKITGLSYQKLTCGL